MNRGIFDGLGVEPMAGGSPQAFERWQEAWTILDAAGTYAYDLPTWADFLDAWLIPGGGGGGGGDSGTALYGSNGSMGAILVRITRKLLQQRLSVVVGAGGNHGNNGTPGTNGGDGGPSSITGIVATSAPQGGRRAVYPTSGPAPALPGAPTIVPPAGVYLIASIQRAGTTGGATRPQSILIPGMVMLNGLLPGQGGFGGILSTAATDGNDGAVVLMPRRFPSRLDT